MVHLGNMHVVIKTIWNMNVMNNNKKKTTAQKHSSHCFGLINVGSV